MSKDKSVGRSLAEIGACFAVAGIVANALEGTSAGRKIEGFLTFLGFIFIGLPFIIFVVYFFPDWYRAEPVLINAFGIYLAVLLFNSFDRNEYDEESGLAFETLKNLGLLPLGLFMLLGISYKWLDIIDVYTVKSVWLESTKWGYCILDFFGIIAFFSKK